MNAGRGLPRRRVKPPGIPGRAEAGKAAGKKPARASAKKPRLSASAAMPDVAARTGGKPGELHEPRRKARNAASSARRALMSPRQRLAGAVKGKTKTGLKAMLGVGGAAGAAGAAGAGKGRLTGALKSVGKGVGRGIKTAARQGWKQAKRQVRTQLWSLIVTCYGTLVCGLILTAALLLFAIGVVIIGLIAVQTAWHDPLDSTEALTAAPGAAYPDVLLTGGAVPGRRAIPADWDDGTMDLMAAESYWHALLKMGLWNAEVREWVPLDQWPRQTGQPVSTQTHADLHRWAAPQGEPLRMLLRDRGQDACDAANDKAGGIFDKTPTELAELLRVESEEMSEEAQRQNDLLEGPNIDPDIGTSEYPGFSDAGAAAFAQRQLRGYGWRVPSNIATAAADLSRQADHLDLHAIQADTPLAAEQQERVAYDACHFFLFVEEVYTRIESAHFGFVDRYADRAGSEADWPGPRNETRPSADRVRDWAWSMWHWPEPPLAAADFEDSGLRLGGLIADAQDTPREAAKLFRLFVIDQAGRELEQPAHAWASSEGPGVEICQGHDPPPGADGHRLTVFLPCGLPVLHPCSTFWDAKAKEVIDGDGRLPAASVLEPRIGNYDLAAQDRFAAKLGRTPSRWLLDGYGCLTPSLDRSACAAFVPPEDEPDAKPSDSWPDWAPKAFDEDGFYAGMWCHVDAAISSVDAHDGVIRRAFDHFAPAGGVDLFKRIAVCATLGDFSRSEDSLYHLLGEEHGAWRLSDYWWLSEWRAEPREMWRRFSAANRIEGWYAPGLYSMRNPPPAHLASSLPGSQKVSFAAYAAAYQAKTYSQMLWAETAVCAAPVRVPQRDCGWNLACQAGRPISGIASILSTGWSVLNTVAGVGWDVFTEGVSAVVDTLTGAFLTPDGRVLWMPSFTYELATGLWDRWTGDEEGVLALPDSDLPDSWKLQAVWQQNPEADEHLARIAETPRPPHLHLARLLDVYDFDDDETLPLFAAAAEDQKGSLLYESHTRAAYAAHTERALRFLPALAFEMRYPDCPATWQEQGLLCGGWQQVPTLEEMAGTDIERCALLHAAIARCEPAWTAPSSPAWAEIERLLGRGAERALGAVVPADSRYHNRSSTGGKAPPVGLMPLIDTAASVPRSEWPASTVERLEGLSFWTDEAGVRVRYYPPDSDALEALPTGGPCDTRTAHRRGCAHREAAPRFAALLAWSASEPLMPQLEPVSAFRSLDSQREIRQGCANPTALSAAEAGCDPPVAYPGRSLHNLGLALDITIDSHFYDASGWPMETLLEQSGFSAEHACGARSLAVCPSPLAVSEWAWLTVAADHLALSQPAGLWQIEPWHWEARLPGGAHTHLDHGDGGPPPPPPPRPSTLAGVSPRSLGAMNLIKPGVGGTSRFVEAAKLVVARFPPAEVATALCVLSWESDAVPSRRYREKNGDLSIGLFQINSGNLAGRNRITGLTDWPDRYNDGADYTVRRAISLLYQPEWNVLAAYEIWAANGWLPAWTAQQHRCQLR